MRFLSLNEMNKSKFLELFAHEMAPHQRLKADYLGLGRNSGRVLGRQLRELHHVQFLVPIEYKTRN